MSEFIFSITATGEYKDKGSSFHAVAFPAFCINDVKSKLFSMKEKYSDASHICYGYRIKIGQRLDEYASDAGEPKGSAGLPILSALKKQNLINSIIIIIRYFGGSKLGIPRLKNAYGIAAGNAIENAKLTMWIEKKSLSITYPYELKGVMDSILKKNKIEVTYQYFGEKIDIHLDIDIKLADKFIAIVNDLSVGKAKILSVH